MLQKCICHMYKVYTKVGLGQSLRTFKEPPIKLFCTMMPDIYLENMLKDTYVGEHLTNSDSRLL